MALRVQVPGLFIRRISCCRNLSRRYNTAGLAFAQLSNHEQVRVRFAPSPTGNLHVGGARTALFNYLFAKSKGGKFILRIEDTDITRSTRESEEAMLQDLLWLGLEWDEGPNKDSEFGPYRQSERNNLYQKYADQLLASNHAYRCFCSDKELEAMREEARVQNLPPKYTGRWANASQDEVDSEIAKGTPFTYRFRVSQEGYLMIKDLIRGEVSWALETLGDFVIMRSNGQPVYNFCVAVDDATMGITHVIRAEEHLPNTLRQALVYQALGFRMPLFGHVSLILAPDRSKLSKRHGATSVGQFKEMGYLPQAMINYLALLGWNDGTEKEIFTIQELIEKFSIDRITKSAAIFDQAKLRWVNGQHFRALPMDQIIKMLGEHWKKSGFLSESEGPFVNEAAEVVIKSGVEVLPDADTALLNLFSYPLHATISSPEAQDIVNDNLTQVAQVILSAYDNDELQSAIEGGQEGWQKWVKEMGKSLKLKGKRLFMPIRLLLTGRLSGIDIGDAIRLLYKAGNSGIVASQGGFVNLDQRIQMIRQIDWHARSVNNANTPENASVFSH